MASHRQFHRHDTRYYADESSLMLVSKLDSVANVKSLNIIVNSSCEPQLRITGLHGVTPR